MPKQNVYGLNIHYQEMGKKQTNTPTLLFIHGWCADLSSFDEQMKYFSETNQCIAVDLPGFGKSSRPKLDYTMTIYGEILNEFCAKLKLKKPVLLGHSLGGLIALEMSWQKPKLPAAIILVDPAPIIKHKDMIQNMQRSLEAIQSKGASHQVNTMMERFLFLPSDPEHLKDQIRKTARNTDQNTAETIWENIITYDGKQAFKSATAPIAYISAEKLQNSYSDLARYQPDMAWAQVMRAAHYAHLSEPQQVNAMIDSFLRHL